MLVSFFADLAVRLKKKKKKKRKNERKEGAIFPVALVRAKSIPPRALLYIYTVPRD